ERLSRSARFFGFTFDPANARDKILQAISNDGKPLCLRLTLSEEGALRQQPGPIPVGHAKLLRLSRVRVDSNDTFLYHKTTHRAIYEAARREWDSETDATLMNERGEITETTIMNIAVFRDGSWITPRVTCGLLSGVMREELLSRGEIAEGVVPANELR